MIAGFEVFGLVGAMFGGWFTDRFLGGRAARACVIYMALAGVSVLLFWKIPTQSELLITGLLCATGFFVYGPQCLLAIACANLATKRAAATAIGLTSIFGYASTVLSGWGLGFVVQNYGWNAGFAGLIGCAAIGTLLFIAAWPAKANGYKQYLRGKKSGRNLIVIHDFHRPVWIRHLRAFRRAPQNAVEQILRALVFLVQRQFRGNHRVLPQMPDQNFFRRRIHFVERDIVRHGVIRGEIRRVRETIKHRRRRRVHLVHRRQTQNQFNRPQQTRLVVLRADGRAAFGVRADDISRRAITADVIPAVLRIVLDGENAGVRPEF